MAKRRTLERWHPPVEPIRQEALLLKRLNRTKKLFRFLREHRHELFDDAFQEEPEGMYRGTGAGLPPVPPAKMYLLTFQWVGLGSGGSSTMPPQQR